MKTMKTIDAGLKVLSYFILLAVLFACNEDEKIECPQVDYSQVNDTEIGCFWKYTDWSDVNTFELIDCTSEKEAYERWQEQKCAVDAYILAWTPKGETGGLTCNCE